MKYIFLFMSIFLISYGNCELLDKLHECSSCKLEWVRHSSNAFNPTYNSGICRAIGDRLIPGELHYSNKHMKTFCKIPYFNKALDVFEYDILKLNNETVRTLYNEQQNPNLFTKIHCTKDKIKELLSEHQHKHH